MMKIVKSTACLIEDIANMVVSGILHGLDLLGKVSGKS